jgi:ketopantoate reductase
VDGLVADLQAWGPAVAHPNVAGHLWSKQSYSAVGATSALVDAPISETIEGHRELTVALAREVYAVAGAIGVHPESFDHWEADAFLPEAPPRRTREVLDGFCAWLRTQPKTKTGIWRDLAVRRRPTEVPAMFEPVLRLADEHGVRCPGVRTTIRLIGELERGERQMTEENVREVERAALGA